MPLRPRQTIYFYAIQKGTYLDTLTSISDLSKTLETVMTDVANNAHLAVLADVKPVIPQLFIDASFPPAILVHEIADTVVSVEESRYTAKQLSDADVDVEELEIPGAEHGFAGSTKAVDGDEMFEQLKPVEKWLQSLLDFEF